MPIAYLPPSHERPPPQPASPTSPPHSILPRSRSSQLSIPLLPQSQSHDRRPSHTSSITSSVQARRRSSAINDLDQEEIKALSDRAKQAEQRAQWEGSKLLSLEPPTTPPRASIARSSSTNSTNSNLLSLYETPSHQPSSPSHPKSSVSRAPRSPRSRDPSRASSIYSSHSNLDAVSEFLQDQDPPSSPRSPAFVTTRPISRPSTSSSTRSSLRSQNRISSIFPSPPSNNSGRQTPSPCQPRSSFDASSSSSSSEESDGGEDSPISTTFAPRLVKTTEMDQFVVALNREKDSVIDERRRRLELEQKKRERGRTKSLSEGEERERERTESGNSDASFASMTAVGPSPPPQSGLMGSQLLVREEEGLSAPGMQRDDTLKASSQQNGGQVRSIEDILKGYKALGAGGNEMKGIMERRRSSVATLPIQPRRIDPSLDEYQGYHHSNSRPLSPASTTTTNSNEPPQLLPYVPFPPTPTTPDSENGTGKIKSIEEIIAQHAGTSYLNKKSPSPTTPSITTNVRTRQLSHVSSASEGGDSVDSIQREHQTALPPSSFRSQRRESSIISSPLPPTPVSSRPQQQPGRETPILSFDHPSSDSHSTHSSIRSLPIPPQSPSPRSQSPAPLTSSSSPSTPTSASQELSLLLKSPRLTRLVTLSRSPNTGLQVSLSDVGSPGGFPVLIFLGLGSVRYLLALYDELAEIFGLRLICIDRWGLGKTTSVPDTQRGFFEWSLIVEEIMVDHLGLESWSVLAHSAGSPYALATALRLGRERVKGTVRLLAPWGGGGQGQKQGEESLAGMYKYLKYVPSGVLKTAQQAEWKIQGWRLGKNTEFEPLTTPITPTSITIKGDEISTSREEKRESLANLGAVVGGDQWEKLEKMYPDGGIRLAGPSNGDYSSTTTSNKDIGRVGTPKRKPSLSVSGKSFLGGIFGSGGNNNSSNRDDSSSTRPSLSPSGIGRRSSYFAANAINSARSTPPPSISEDSTSMSTSASSRSLLPSGLPMPSTPTTSISNYGPPSPSIYSTHATTPNSIRPSSSHSHRAVSPSLLSPTSPSTRSSISPAQLISGLLRASHAESLQGSTSDLLVLLDRTSSNSNAKKIDYGLIEQKVEVWYGDRDDRISESSVRWLEKEMRDCKVRIVKGGDHNLMTSELTVLALEPKEKLM